MSGPQRHQFSSCLCSCVGHAGASVFLSGKGRPIKASPAWKMLGFLFVSSKFQTTWSNGFYNYVSRASPASWSKQPQFFGPLLWGPASPHFLTCSHNPCSCCSIEGSFPSIALVWSPGLETGSEKPFALRSPAPSKALCKPHPYRPTCESGGSSPSECRERGAGRRRKEKVRASRLTPHLFVSSPCGSTFHPLLQWESAC